jgi:hypothetical protein
MSNVPYRSCRACKRSIDYPNPRWVYFDGRSPVGTEYCEDCAGIFTPYQSAQRRRAREKWEDSRGLLGKAVR